ncbi:MAG: 50S ribosomal protein L22 [Endomicrobiales bacterium]|nr:50S ribosomal protein L22 [Endomicrobiales bacterium]
MLAIAKAKFVRYAPRKVNQVLGLIRNKPVEKAFETLSFTPKAVSEIVAKTLKSAVANAGRLKNMSGLKVKEAWVGHGPALKRMRPGPMGRGLPYKRKMCHISVSIAEILPGEMKQRKKKISTEIKPETVKTAKKHK